MTFYRPWLPLLLLLVPQPGHAELVVRAGEAVDTPQVRFFPVNQTRNGNPSGLKQGSKKVRSDSAAMADGFFRIDRTHTVPTRGPLVVRVPSTTDSTESPSLANEPRIIYGGPKLNAQPSMMPIKRSSSFTEFQSLPKQRTATRTTAENSGSILSLFSAESSNQPSSFREALRTMGTDSKSEISTPHQWPVPSDYKQRLSSQYGFRSDPFHGETKFHSGIDIASPVGTPVVASAAGIVTESTTLGGYGKTIAIQHADGSQSRYSHLHEQQARVGQTVAAGQQIGTVGSSGRSTGAHLDYSLTKDGVTLNPFEALNKSTMKTASNTLSPSPAAPTQKSAAHKERIIIVE